ncbi:MAG: hypothetical protein IJD10_02900 [Clostridia bacterium]|nr:hypothetical protein [Clostridia bacterium]
MNKKQYNNVIEYTLTHETNAQCSDSLKVVRAIFNNMGIALPNGDIGEVYETIKTNDYMGWRSCTMQEAQAAANNGTAAIGISKDRIAVLSANDEEQPVTQTASVMTLDENTSAFVVEGMQYYSYSYGTTDQCGSGSTDTFHYLNTKEIHHCADYAGVSGSLFHCTATQIKAILSRYNGTGTDAQAYGNECYEYYKVFKKYS